MHLFIILQILFLSLCSRACHCEQFNGHPIVKRSGSIDMANKDGDELLNEKIISWRKFKRVCYFSMDPKTEMKVEQIDGYLCNYIVFSFCRLGSEGEIVFGRYTDGKYLDNIPSLKSKYRNLKVLISILEDGVTSGITNAYKSEAIRDRFTKSAIRFMDRYGVDGLDLHREFVNDHGTESRDTNDREGFTEIVKSLRKAFGEKYLLTLAMPAQSIESHYEVAKVAEQVDWMNIMANDYFSYSSSTPFTGPIAPLHAIVKDTSSLYSNMSVEWTVNEYLRLGAPKDKLVLGVPTYARGYRLPKTLSWSRPRPFMEATGSKSGKRGDFFTFKEVCQMWLRSGNQWHIDADAKTAYLISQGSILSPGPTFISFQEKRSIEYKAEFIMHTGLAGYATWDLNSDNFDGPCYINDELRNVLHRYLLHSIETIMGIPGTS